MTSLKQSAQKILDSLESSKTEFPYVWTIEDYVEVDSHDSEFVKYWHGYEEIPYIGSPEDIAEEIIKWDSDYGIKTWTQEERKDLIENIQDQGVGISFEYQGIDIFFFSKESAENFLNSNSHHYHDKARITKVYQWRNYELKVLQQILKEFCKN